MKEYELLEFFLLPKNSKKQTGFARNFLEIPNTNCAEVPQSFISKHPFFDIPSFSKISQPPV